MTDDGILVARIRSGLDQAAATIDAPSSPQWSPASAFDSRTWNPKRPKRAAMAAGGTIVACLTLFALVLGIYFDDGEEAKTVNAPHETLGATAIWPSNEAAERFADPRDLARAFANAFLGLPGADVAVTFQPSYLGPTSIKIVGHDTNVETNVVAMPRQDGSWVIQQAGTGLLTYSHETRSLVVPSGPDVSEIELYVRGSDGKTVHSALSSESSPSLPFKVDSRPVSALAISRDHTGRIVNVVGASFVTHEESRETPGMMR